MSTAIAAIPAFDYREQFAAIEDEIMAAVRAVLGSGSLILGPRVADFERDFAEFLGGGCTVGVGNGTDALAIALRALNVGPDDEVITVANTAVPTISAIRMVGARPVFCDVDRATLLMDFHDFEARITPRTRAVVPVHLYGHAVDMPALGELAARHRLAVVEDCAQACGTTIDGRHVGTFGDSGAFSFYPTKNLGAYGDGGLCFTRRADLAEIMRQIRFYGRDERGECVREGMNSRLDELQAAILTVKLRHLAEHLAERRRVAATYDALLAPHVERPRIAPNIEHSFHLYVVLVPRRAELCDRLRAQQIGYGIHYPQPVHRQRGYSFLDCEAGTLPQTEWAANRVLSLPCYPELSRDAIERICQVVNDHCQLGT
ncbi:MAG: DegT/DnrJ/EryC1/StrS family aminotransferase [Pirellulales bacterium]